MSDALRVSRNSVKDGEVTACVEGPDDQKNREKSCDESEDSTKAEVAEESEASEVTVDSVDSRVVQNSSIMYSRKAILFYFLLSSTFAIIISFWIIHDSSP